MLFDYSKPSLEAAQLILLEWLRNNRGEEQVALAARQYEAFVETRGGRDWGTLERYIMQAYWELVVEGILVPGITQGRNGFPWFQVTDYGKTVLDEAVPQPHDPRGYLDALRKRVRNPDETVMVYLAESLDTFRRGSLVAATVMLGVAAERVFLLLCESAVDSLADLGEKSQFEGILNRFPMRPKLDWMQGKLQSLQKARASGFPENSTIMVTAVYEMMRAQRNQFGHPKEDPPRQRREDIYANLVVFARYYEVAESVRVYFAANPI